MEILTKIATRFTLNHRHLIPIYTILYVLVLNISAYLPVQKLGEV